LQQQNNALQNAKKTAELSVKEYKEVNEKLLHQQQISEQRFQTSRQTIKVKGLLRWN
jgi:centlein